MRSERVGVGAESEIRSASFEGFLLGLGSFAFATAAATGFAAGLAGQAFFDLDRAGEDEAGDAQVGFVGGPGGVGDGARCW